MTVKYAGASFEKHPVRGLTVVVHFETEGGYIQELRIDQPDRLQIDVLMFLNDQAHKALA